MTDTATDTARYIAAETRVSMAINAVLSAAVFVAVFGLAAPAPVWGMGGYVTDFGPQSFMIALMATLVPGALTRRRLRSGAVQPLAGTSRLPASLLLRALLLGLVAAVFGTALFAGILNLVGVAAIAPVSALIAKVAYGALLAAIVTPVGLLAVLRQN